MERRPFRLRRCLRLHLSPHLTLGDKEPQPNTEAAAAPSLTIITHFTQKLVEKLYSGMFSADARHILLFITEHIMAVRTPLAMVVWKLPTTCPSDMLQLHRWSRPACGPPWKQDLRWWEEGGGFSSPAIPGGCGASCRALTQATRDPSQWSGATVPYAGT